ncbi:DUF1499 domain-containing protein [Sulfuricaulis sp.]|uniref:DUF1499 domain-containing protein n=1 Tax=Sulfuricaulis sp. TaxID=2003553 RepID=UPI0025F67F50|nr:DUF1499 domain-containing protein [Sulfuricaulis sp.]
MLLAISGAMFSITAMAVSEAMAKNLAPCPSSPNCVLSDATDSLHHVPHFAINLPVDEAWRLVREAVNEMPRTKVVETTGNYLHAECTSMIFRFVDDLEFELRVEGIIAVRSASRTGRRDFGVNRRRVEQLREILRAKGVIK